MYSFNARACLENILNFRELFVVLCDLELIVLFCCCCSVAVDYMYLSLGRFLVNCPSVVVVYVLCSLG